MFGSLRLLAGLWALAELALLVVVAEQIGWGWTVLATIVTGLLGCWLLARQGTRAVLDLRRRVRLRESPGRAAGDAGLVALGAALMVLPGFLSDVAGLLCLLSPTRALPRVLIARLLVGRLPAPLRGPVRVRSSRAGQVRTSAAVWPRVIEGEVGGRGGEGPHPA
jgi:UPF0716 protein FxsA